MDPLVDMLANSSEANKLNDEVAALRAERDRLRQRVADLGQAQEDLVAAQAALDAKASEAALLIRAMLSSIQ
jgi:cell division protein FtsB